MGQFFKNLLNWSIKKYREIPKQVSHLFVLFIIFMALFIFGRQLLTPKTFGEYGHYRAAAVELNKQDSLKYAGSYACVECHDDIVEMKQKYLHKNLSCETCHGPAFAHTQDPDENGISAPRDRGYCLLCHGYNPSRPTGFPQVDALTHNPLKSCMVCHDAHAPEPPHAPEECSACHADIVRTKSVSHHQLLSCSRCHQCDEEHKITPGQIVPTKPENRDFCGECHANDVQTSQEIPKIDMATHGEKYTCWQCHYPHFPEAYR
jgi:hypothetical protein